MKANTGEKELALTVRGPAPHNFFAKLRDRLTDTFKRFPGLEYERMVPCLCSEGCENEFDLNGLEATLEDDDPITDNRSVQLEYGQRQELMRELARQSDVLINQRLLVATVLK